MRKALVILVAVALLGIAAAYVNPLGPESTASTAVSASKGSSSGSAGTTASAGSSVATATGSGAAATAARTGYADGAFQGDTYSNRYGEVQLSVVIQNGKITDITTDVLTANEPESQQIDSYAVPQLKSQALAAQSANIDGVSGASFTSASYEQSLQSALDKARA